MKPIFKDGKLVYNRPTLKEIAAYEDASTGQFFPEYKRVINTQEYKVDLSYKLWKLKNELLNHAHEND